MNLIVIQPGKYNDTNGRAKNYAKDDLLITSLDYGQGLVDSGYAVPAETHIPETFHPEPEPELEPELPKRRGKK